MYMYVCVFMDIDSQIDGRTDRLTDTHTHNTHTQNSGKYLHWSITVSLYLACTVRYVSFITPLLYIYLLSLTGDSERKPEEASPDTGCGYVLSGI